MKRGSRCGFTIIEALISSTLFVSIMGAFVLSLFAAERARDDAEVADQLNREALEVIETLRRDLSRSGYENGFPLSYDEDDIGQDYGTFVHAAPHGEQERCDVVYRLPADDDGDGWPDVDVDGDVTWEGDPRAFVLVPNQYGTNDFMRIAADGQSSTVARNVESLRYSSPAETAFAIPLDCMRVELGLRADSEGIPQRVRMSAVIRLENGGLAP